jgi:hypothetical protein
MQINPWIKNKAVFTGKLADDKEALQRQIQALTIRFSQCGGVIKVLQPGFAEGCKIPLTTRQMIRRGW